MVFMGTTVSGGSGEAAVVATGDATEIGRIQALAGGAERPATPVELELESLGRRLVYIAGGVCVAMFGIGILRGYPQLVMLKNAIALAVAAVPEGLPTVATTTLAVGLNEMKRRHALIRRLDAVESLGALQVVCFDKTGTLTQNTMTVRKMFLGAAQTEQLPSGMPEKGSSFGLHALLRTAVLCNEAKSGPDGNGNNHTTGSATEAALLELAGEHGVDADAVRAAHPVLRTSYRDGSRRRMTTVHRSPQGDCHLVAMKGSPEEVLNLCSTYHTGTSIETLDDGTRAAILAANTQMGADGLRVLGFATREIDISGDVEVESEQDLVWLGLAGLADPIRDAAPDLMKRFHAAGIRTVMITGDQASTAEAVARDLGLAASRRPKIITAGEIDAATPEELGVLARDADVFARVSPSHKLKIVQALQRAGYVVGMTGDGVNDGPALRAADIGIAMGLNGSDVAKDMANVVLSDDNLSTLVDAIAQGRTIHANIKKALRFLLATNLSEIVVTLGEALHGPNELETPLELLWINLVTDVLPALGLAMLPPDADVLTQKPRPTKSPLLSNEDFRWIGIDGAIIGASTLGAHLYALGSYGPGPQTRAITFSSIVLSQLLYAYTCRGAEDPDAARPPLFASRPLNLTIAASLGLHALPLFVPGIQRLLGISGLAWRDVPVVAMASLLPFAYREATHVRRSNPADGLKG
jgi:Ca2+-transporting ATPase